MNVKLMQVTTKVADYDLKEENYSSMPYNVFKSLIGMDEKTADRTEKVVVFKSRDEFIATSKVLPVEFDEKKPVYVGPTGQIFCFIKADAAENDTKDAAADTQKDSE